MIDTDKYEGHTPAPWELNPDDWVWAEHLFMQGNTTNFGNAMLITDAPLLLAEVKRMNRFAHCAMNFMSKHDLHFQFLNEHGVYTAPDGGSISMFIPYSYKWDDETKVSSESIQFTVRGEEE